MSLLVDLSSTWYKHLQTVAYLIDWGGNFLTNDRALEMLFSADHLRNFVPFWIEASKFWTNCRFFFVFHTLFCISEHGRSEHNIGILSPLSRFILSRMALWSLMNSRMSYFHWWLHFCRCALLFWVWSYFVLLNRQLYEWYGCEIYMNIDYLMVIHKSTNVPVVVTCVHSTLHEGCSF